MLLHADSSLEDEQESETKSGDPETKFKYRSTKTNDFDDVLHPNSKCVICDEAVQDEPEGNFYKELYICIKCGNLSGTMASLDKHLLTHNSVICDNVVPDEPEGNFYKELYICIKCGNLSGTSLDKHQLTHNHDMYPCKAASNHEQKPFV